MPGGPKSTSQRLLAAMGSSNGAQVNGHHVAPDSGRQVNLATGEVEPAVQLPTAAQVAAEMARIGPHFDRCKCREVIANGGRMSRCW